MVIKKFSFTFFLILLVLFSPQLINAQEEVDFGSIEVSLWPEYDQPELLVIYRITLPASSSLPANISLRIPASAGTPNAVAAGQPDGSLINLTFNQEQIGEWSVLNFTTTSPEMQIEYYDPGIVYEGDIRSIEYQWPGDHSVEKMVVQVQQPRYSTNMQITPNLGEGIRGGDGLLYYSADIGSLDRGQSFTISSQYEKDTNELSVDEMGVAPLSPIEPAMNSVFNLESVLPYLLALLGLLLIFGGGVWYWRTGMNQKPVKTRRKKRRSAKQTKDANSASEAAHVYCHHCGKRAQSGDRFCRACGSQLRLRS